MESKHTPGPWSVEHDYKPFVIKAGSSVIASITGTAAMSEAAEANAELIAQAPTLKAQRDELLNLAKYARQRVPEHLHAVFDAAIARAEGGK